MFVRVCVWGRKQDIPEQMIELIRKSKHEMDHWPGSRQGYRGEGARWEGVIKDDLEGTTTCKQGMMIFAPFLPSRMQQLFALIALQSGIPFYKYNR